jgi:hypothetical protein
MTTWRNTLTTQEAQRLGMAELYAHSPFDIGPAGPWMLDLAHLAARLDAIGEPVPVPVPTPDPIPVPVPEPTPQPTPDGLKPASHWVALFPERFNGADKRAAGGKDGNDYYKWPQNDIYFAGYAVRAAAIMGQFDSKWTETAITLASQGFKTIEASGERVSLHEGLFLRGVSKLIELLPAGNERVARSSARCRTSLGIGWNTATGCCPWTRPALRSTRS